MASLPDYVASAQPVPKDARSAWYKNTAQTYAGIMLWFVFWQDMSVGSGICPAKGEHSAFAGGVLSSGLGIALLGVVVAALICHFLFYLVPGLMGMKTGLPLYIVGTSTYGVQGGFLMPGFLMGLLQFGWLGVNAFFAGVLLCAPWDKGPLTIEHAIVSTVWAVAAAFMGLKGIQYVAKVATFLPLIPLVILIILFVKSSGGLSDFKPEELAKASDGQVVTATDTEFKKQRVPGVNPVSVTVEKKNATDEEKEEGAVATVADLKEGDTSIITRTYPAAWVEVEKTETFVTKPPLEGLAVFALICTYIVGFFATAGAAGADFGMNNRDSKDVQLGGLVGIAGATIFSGGLALLIVAGAMGSAPIEEGAAVLRTTGLMEGILGDKNTADVCMYLLAIAAFPPACFSAFIAANSFKTTLPNVNPIVSVGCGTLVSIILAVTALAGDVIGMFTIIGASFGPICGAMAADYLLAGRKWAGPRAGFNPAGWISWVAGFAVGIDMIPGLAGNVYCPPVAAFIVGFGLYAVLAQAGLQSKTLDMPQVAKE